MKNWQRGGGLRNVRNQRHDLQAVKLTRPPKPNRWFQLQPELPILLFVRSQARKPLRREDSRHTPEGCVSLDHSVRHDSLSGRASRRFLAGSPAFFRLSSPGLPRKPRSAAATKYFILCDGVNERADGRDGDADLIAAAQGESVRRHDAGARHEVATVRERVVAEQPVG